jgi:hypothetical protein
MVTVMQSAKSGDGYDPTTCIGILRSMPARRCSLLQRKMRSIFMVQVGYKTPIKLVIAKSITVGTLGAGGRCRFKSRRDAEAEWYFAACKAR